MKRESFIHDGSDAGSKRFHAVVKSARADGREAARASIAKRGFVRTRRIVRRVCDSYAAGRRSPYVFGWGDGALDALVDHAYRETK